MNILKNKTSWLLTLAIIFTAIMAPAVQAGEPTQHKTITINGVEVFYREAGQANAPTILLLHGFPTSSHMFRNLIPALSDRFHLLAPDYPGFGNSAQPALEDFDYSFDGLAELMEGFLEAKGIEQYSVYLMDYGAPVGFRLAADNPEKVGVPLLTELPGPVTRLISKGPAPPPNTEAVSDPSEPPLQLTGVGAMVQYNESGCVIIAAQVVVHWF